MSTTHFERMGKLFFKPPKDILEHLDASGMMGAAEYLAEQVKSGNLNAAYVALMLAAMLHQVAVRIIERLPHPRSFCELCHTRPLIDAMAAYYRSVGIRDREFLDRLLANELHLHYHLHWHARHALAHDRRPKGVPLADGHAEDDQDGEQG